MLGAAGFLKVPIDIISAPAANICIGMAVYSMIHLVFAVRRNRHLGTDPWKVWMAKNMVCARSVRQLHFTPLLAILTTNEPPRSI